MRGSWADRPARLAGGGRALGGAGLLLPATARALGAKHQVWLDSMVPDGRCSLLSELREVATEIVNPEWLGVDPIDDHQAAVRFLFHDCPPSTQSWALTTLRRFIPNYAYAHPISLVEEIPSTYVACSLDRTLKPWWCADVAARRLGVHAAVLDTGHCPHVSDPDGVARILTAVMGAPRR
ncbi:alpha/beta fold hydrolase [Nocardia uniformis]|uniref:alpha/beta fold hydrolase n=1 Tax=Nocardia uniformis TaxID=53432 RepID=UPI0024812405|nr:alpha/beta fold hydrolase [Nocardia uniformis]